MACSDPAAESGPSGAICPEASTLTYETFGREFMEAYCTRCHARTVTGTGREGAPSDHNFDTLEGVHGIDLAHIDEESAAGPAHVNTAMPPDDPRPTEAERRALGEWLACGAP